MATVALGFGPLALLIMRILNNDLELHEIYGWMPEIVFARGEDHIERMKSFSEIRFLIGVPNVITPKNLTSFLVMSSWNAFAFIATLSYTTFLVSSLTFQGKEKPLQTWDDVLKSDYFISFAYGTNEQLKVEVQQKLFHLSKQK